MIITPFNIPLGL